MFGWFDNQESKITITESGDHFKVGRHFQKWRIKMDKLNEIFDFIVEWNIATEEEIKLVTNINGWNED